MSHDRLPMRPLAAMAETPYTLCPYCNRRVEPGDVVVFGNDREAIVTARVDARAGDPIQALLEVAPGEPVAPKRL